MTHDQIMAAVREIVSENLRSNNAEFKRQVLNGEHDDGPYMQVGLAVSRFFQESFMLLSHPEVFDDE